MDEVKEFISNEEKNTYTIKVKEENEDRIILSIQDDFDFTFNTSNFQLSTEDDFLLELVEKVNSLNLSDGFKILQECTKSYSKLIDDDQESPLYKGQDVFELENDNHDIKFVSRIRFKEEDFNSDLWVNVFEFLDVNSVLNASRVCKKWNKMCNQDSVWKKFCIMEGTTELNEKTWKEEFSNCSRSIQYTLTQSSQYPSCLNTLQAIQTENSMEGVGTNSEYLPWVQASFRKSCMIKTVTLCSMDPSAPGGWGCYYLNGASLEISDDGIVWKTVETAQGHMDQTCEKVIYKIGKRAKYFRLIRNESNYLGLSYMAFNEKN